MPLSKDQILNATDTLTESVKCPEWGGVVLIRRITGEERDRFEMQCSDAKQGETIDIRGLKAKLVIACAVDEAGAQLFTHEDLAALNKKAAAPIDRLYKVASRLNGLSEDDEKALLENAKSDPTEGSGSKSPE